MGQIERLVYESDVAAIGTFRCPRNHRRFAGGSTKVGLAVFPRTAVVIEREWAEPVLADPNTTVFYNPGESYRRRGVDRRGDHCDYFALATALVEEIGTAPPVDGATPHRTLLAFTHGPAPAGLYLAQRRLVEALEGGEPIDPLYVDELAIAVFAAAVSEARSAMGRTSSTPLRTRHRHRAVVGRARRAIAEHGPGPLSLGELARTVAVSPYHLARLFRCHTGFTVHGYVTQVRLRRGLDRMLREDIDLATLGMELGFSSHSHFTSAFRRTFGLTPSAVRKGAPDLASDLRKILTV